MKSLKDKIEYLEGMAMGIWKTQLWLNEKQLSGHCKHYDPLQIEKVNDEYKCLSYVFDFKNGGREHYFKTLEDIEEALFEEIQK